LVEFEFFATKCIKTAVLNLPKFGGEIPTLSKIEPFKFIMPSKIIMNKTSKNHVKSLTWFKLLLYDRNLHRKTNKKKPVKLLTRFRMIEIFNKIKKHVSPSSLANYDVGTFCRNKS